MLKNLKIILNILSVVFICLVLLPALISGQTSNSKKITPILPLLLESEEQSCVDSDGDTYFVQEDCGTSVDCNDDNPAIHPGMPENCSDGIDNDCDELTDGDDTDFSECIDIKEPNETCGYDDSMYFRIKVVGAEGDYSCEEYSLTIDMWQDEAS